MILLVVGGHTSQNCQSLVQCSWLPEVPLVGSDRYGFFRHLQIQIICRFRFADISANADDLQIHAFIGRYGNISADLRGYLQIFEDI